MKKQLFFLAVAALALASCSSENDVVQTPAAQQTSEPGAVAFDAYAQRNTTRAGETGIMNIDLLKTSGFGVFAYYTDNNDYEQSRIPDFMYNQLVKWDGTTDTWLYEPIKYWPNEYGNSAISDDNDRVTFFAYAPYVEVTPTSGKIAKKDATDDQWGITAMTRNSATGNPMIKYIASFDQTKAVDLCWGVCDDPQWALVQGGTTQSINSGALGLPWLNVQRPAEAATQAAATQRMKFTFKHALSQFSVNIDAYVDGNDNTNPLDSKSKIYVRQISFTGFALKGSLDLNNDEPNKARWFDYNGTADLESGAIITVYDGLKDGKEGTAGATASNEKTTGLNPNIISNYNNTSVGVLNSPQALFASSVPVMVIPTGEEMEVEIIYDVETADNNLSTLLSDGKTLGSSVENRIKKTVTFGEYNMENGKHYTLNLHLGMNSVKFDAAVSPWVEAGQEPDAELPSNMPQFAASTTPSLNTVTIPYSTTNYIFAVTGLAPTEAVNGTAATAGVWNGKTVTVNSKPDFTGTANQANGSGVAYVKIEGAENKTVNNIAAEGNVVIKGSTSGATVYITSIQLAHPLGLGVESVNDDGTEFVLKTSATDYHFAKAEAAATYSYKKNGVEVVKATAPVELDLTGKDNKLDLSGSGEPAAGDVYEITVKAGDAEPETWVVNMGGIVYSPTAGTVIYHKSQTYTTPYTIISNKVLTPSITSGDQTVATVNSDLSINTLKAGNSTITATLTVSNDAANGWYYNDVTKSATYALKVDKQDAVGTFEQADVTNAPISPGNPVTAALNATFKGALDGEDADGNVSYEVEKVLKNGTEINETTFMVHTTNFKLYPNITLDNNTTYTVTVKATKAAGNKYAAAEKSVTFNVTTVAN